MIRAVLSTLVVGGLLVGGWAIAGENCAKSCAKAKVTAAQAGDGCCQEKAKLSAEAREALNANAAYQKADALLKSWSDTPAKLVAMNEGDKAALASSAEKMSGHPAVHVMKPSIELVRESLKTAVQIDRAAADLCAAKCGLKGEATSADAKPSCPKAAAAKLRFEQSAGYVMKASHLIGTASKTVGECGGKSDCAKAKKVADAGGCPKAAAAKLAEGSSIEATLVADKADGEKPCAKAAAAKAEGKSECTKTKTVAAEGGEKACHKTAAAKAGGEGGCVKSKTVAADGEKRCDKAKTVAGEGEKSCSKAKAVAAAGAGEKPCAKQAALAAGEGEKPCAKKAALAAGEGEKGCAKAAMAAGAGEKPCPKALAAKAEALVNDSGKLLAQWQHASVTLASMDAASRTSLEEACAGAMAKCPAGRLMPETLATARELLVEATKLTAQCQAEAAKSGKEIPAELKELMQARTLLISSAINVLERAGTMAKPAKQMAMAQ